jgi:hypothetical protein
MNYIVQNVSSGIKYIYYSISIRTLTIKEYLILIISDLEIFFKRYIISSLIFSSNKYSSK